MIQRISLYVLVTALAASTSVFSGDDAGAEKIFPPFKVWKDVVSPELKSFQTPVAERFELPNGMVVFLLEDHELPLIDLSLTLRFGDIHEPADKAGISDATANVMRSGGSAKYPGDKLDEILEDMAASMGFGIGTDSGSASLSTLKDDFDRGLEIFNDVLRSPAFPDDKVDLYLSQARTAVSKRNDQPNAIAQREFRRAVYGEKSPYAKQTEYATLNKINAAALREFHQAFFHPNLVIVGVVGDFKKAEMLEKLKKTFGDWPRKDLKLPTVAPISTDKKRKTLFADRPRINQTTITLGHVIEMRRDSKDYPAIQMLNEILSGGMSARMFTEVRTKKGLAYSVWGFANVPYDRPGVFSCTALTRNEQALDTVAAIREEVVKIREHGVTQRELDEARETILNSFVFNFDAPSKIIGRQMTYEHFGYPMDFAEKMLEAIKKVSVEDVNRVAKKYLDPDKAILLGVGNAAGLEEGKSFRGLKDVQLLDVTIPLPQAEPMVLDAKREADGKRLLAECLQAAGGVDAFRAIKGIRAMVQLTVKGFKLRGCMCGQLPEQVRVDVAGPFGPISQIMTREKAWKATGGSVQELKPQEAKKNLRSLVQSDLGLMCVLATAQEGYNVQALDPVRDGERELTGVEIESQSLGRIKIWFDAKTHLIAKLRYADEKEKEFDKVFSNHEKFGNIILARTLTDKDPAGPQTIELQELELNPTLDGALFTRPERASPPPK